MSQVSKRIAALREAGLKDAAKLVYRKAIYRKVVMGRYEVRAADSVPPARDDDLRIELLGPEDFDRVGGSSPYLTAEDLRDFHRQSSTCIVAFDGPRIAASTWMTNGHVYVHELQRHVEVPPDEHLSCRTYVDDAYRGRALMQQLIYSYARICAPQDLVWGLIHPWNVASIRSVERLGWRQTGDYWTRHVFGRQVAGERSFPARPASSLSSAS
jgi:GNAT superfamily N-acetyltransferase